MNTVLCRYTKEWNKIEQTPNPNAKTNRNPDQP